MATLEISVSEFKAKCLDLFDQISEGELEAVTVTRRGKPVAQVLAPVRPKGTSGWHGAMRGTFEIAPGVDVTEPAHAEPWDAELGTTHR